MLARSVLWYVTFAGFAINYMHRIHINIILVGMVKPKVRGSVGSANSSGPVSECISSYPTLENNNQSISDSSIVKIIHEDGFDWDERQQNYILGSFFWLHWLTQIPGGILARRFGTKKIFGLSNFIACLLTLILPTVAKFDFRLLVFVRILQGFITGVAWPSMHHLTAHWIPPNERSKFVSSYLGSSVGVAVTYSICGFIMDSYGWEAAFYATGFFGVAWYICWLCLVFDTPGAHPRITAKEKQYIEKSLEQAITKRKMPVPWRHVLLSGPIWMVALAQWGGIWGFYTLMTQAPTYFKNILGWNIKMTGIFSGIPHLTRWLFSFISAIAADYLLKSKLLSRTNVRKLATSTCTLVQGIMVLGLAMSGCNSTAAIVFLIAATGVSGAVSSGPLACVVDISPNFASVLLGLVGLTGNLPGFMSPLVVGYLTYQQQTAEQWQKVFLITTAILVVTGILYIMYGEAEVQAWNNGSQHLKDVENEDEKETEKEKEMKVIPLLIEQQNTTNGFTIGGDDNDEKRSL